MDNHINRKINLYQITVILSVLFTLVGFSYNVWRMEVSENNNNIRTASFEMLKNLSSLEQLIYAAHYDNDTKEGNPRKGWVTIGLVNDLSILTSKNVKTKTLALKNIWSEHWESMPSNKLSVDTIVKAIDSVRDEIKYLLISLE